MRLPITKKYSASTSVHHFDKADKFDEKDYNNLKEAISAVSISAAGGVA